MLWSVAESNEFEEQAMRRQIVAFLEEHCRGMTLRDAHEWFPDAFADRP
jgi:hypothetical protein